MVSMQNWRREIFEEHKSRITLCLWQLFLNRLRRFIDKLEDVDVDEIAASLPPIIQIYNPAAAGDSCVQELRLSREQVLRFLRAAAGYVFSFDKAKRTVQRQLERRMTCRRCADHVMGDATAEAEHGSEATEAIAQPHTRIDEELRMRIEDSWMDVAAAIVLVDTVALVQEQVCHLLHCLAHSEIYAEFDKAMELHQEEQQLQSKQEMHLITLVKMQLSDPHPVCTEKWLRNTMHTIVALAPSIEVSKTAKSLPQLQTSHGRPSPMVSLSEQQVRHCLHGIAETVRFHKVMASLQRAAAEEKCLSLILWEQMIRESKFAIFVTDDFNRLSTVHAHCRHAEMRKALNQDLSKGFALMVERAGIYPGYNEIERARFLERSKLKRPDTLRFIDVEASSREGVVCLVEFEQADGDTMTTAAASFFTAISHTYGADVYEIFNCGCATKSVAVSCGEDDDDALKPKPRARMGACPHHSLVSPKMKQKRDQVVGDILRMCGILKGASVRYAWHDGVCIAQHDEEEVKATIERIGWVYAYAADTIIFLHYVGKPRALLNPGDLMMKWTPDDLVARWHTRAWTFQEAALSPKRSYCVRVGSISSSPLSDTCHSLDEFERKVEEWYNDETSSIQVVEETNFMDMVREAYSTLERLYYPFSEALEAEYLREDMDDVDRLLLYPKMCTDTKADVWCKSLSLLVTNFAAISFSFPTAAKALEGISERDCKHVGDRINSILALSGVTGFVAPKDVDVERSTIEFFRRQNQRGLQTALYAVNKGEMEDDSGRPKRWIPSLEATIHIPHRLTQGNDMYYLVYDVLGGDDEKLEVVGEVVCVKVNFRVSNNHSLDTDYNVVASPSPESVGSYQQPVHSSDLKAHAGRVARHINAFIPEGSSISGAGDEYKRLFEEYVTSLEQHVIESLFRGQGHGSMGSSALLKHYTEILFQDLHDSNAVHGMALQDYTGTAESVPSAGVVERIMCHHQETGISIELRPQIENKFEAVWPGDPAAKCSFGQAFSPYILRRTNTFSASLMLPLECHTALQDWPLLMLEGDDIHGPVSKVGVLEPSKLFRACIHHFIQAHPEHTTRLSRLVIN